MMATKYTQVVRCKRAEWGEPIPTNWWAMSGLGGARWGGGRSSILGGNYKGKKVLTQLQPRIRERRWARQKKDATNSSLLVKNDNRKSPQKTNKKKQKKQKGQAVFTWSSGWSHKTVKTLTQQSLRRCKGFGLVKVHKLTCFDGFDYYRCSSFDVHMLCL